MCHKAKQEHQESLCREIEELDRKHNPTVYNIIKNLRNRRISGNNSIKDKDQNTPHIEQDIMERWAECVEDTYDDTDRPLKIKPEVSQCIEGTN